MGIQFFFSLELLDFLKYVSVNYVEFSYAKFAKGEYDSMLIPFLSLDFPEKKKISLMKNIYMYISIRNFWKFVFQVLI